MKMTIRCFSLIMALLLSLCLFSGCSQLDQMMGGTTEEEEEDDGTLKLFAQIGDGSTFGNKKLKWMATTDKDVLTYFGLHPKQVEITENQVLSKETPIEFSDMYASAGTYEFTFADKSHLQLNRYLFSFHYTDERVRNQDLRKVKNYIQETYGKLITPEENGTYVLYKMSDHTFCRLNVYDEFSPNGEYHLDVLVSQGVSDTENDTDWVDLTSLIGLEREEAMDELKLHGITLSVADKKESRDTAALFTASPEENIFGYQLSLLFALSDKLDGYTKSFSGTVYHDAAFAMKLYDFLTIRYGTPVSAEQNGQEITAVTAAGWDHFFLQWSKDGHPENITNEETGLTSRTLRAYWPNKKVSLTLTVSLNTEIEDFLRLQVTFGEMPEPEPEKQEKDDTSQDLIEDSSVEIQ